ncbi:MAG TPA: hypothetical protein VJT31_42300, partial [Rugosimonospora sp.]|nr:hypothetical protein [Rugosimonospora sp.]
GRATAALARGLGGTGVEQVLARCPRPWPDAVAGAVLTALDQRISRHGADWRIAAVCELAALRLPAALAPDVVEHVSRWRALRPTDPGITIVERLAATVRYRCDMIEELR